MIIRQYIKSKDHASHKHVGIVLRIIRKKNNKEVVKKSNRFDLLLDKENSYDMSNIVLSNDDLEINRKIKSN